MDEAAEQLYVSRATVYRLLARYKQNLEATALLPDKPGRRPGTRELGQVQEKIVHDAIRGFFLSKQRPSVAALHRSIALDCFQAGMPKPAYKTVRARVNAVDPQECVRAREGYCGDYRCQHDFFGSAPVLNSHAFSGRPADSWRAFFGPSTGKLQNTCKHKESRKG